MIEYEQNNVLEINDCRVMMKMRKYQCTFDHIKLVAKRRKRG